MSNYPIGAENDPSAPYNEKFKEIEITISVSLSKTETILLPENIDETDPWALEIAVRNQIKLPQDYIEEAGDWWYLDEMCITS